ncbi:hypothetical protein [Nonomuraea sp. LPB2021202275-12-8]|uniref:hypothetical protein n=1 Tax=Nonomuraea sp. LPB2021202275-12-8 TaxID=3120159 RepID=UPI00300CCB4C
MSKTITTSAPEPQFTSPEARQTVIAYNEQQYVQHHTAALKHLRNAQDAAARCRAALDERARLQKEIAERQERLTVLQPEIGKWEDLRVREEDDAQRERGVGDAFGELAHSLGGKLPPIEGSEAWINGREQKPSTPLGDSVWTPAAPAGTRT